MVYLSTRMRNSLLVSLPLQADNAGQIVMFCMMCATSQKDRDDSAAHAEGCDRAETSAPNIVSLGLMLGILGCGSCDKDSREIQGG
jgi:hypothetical protein